MIKLMIIGRRAPGISRSAAHRHLRDVHGQMVVRPPAAAGAMPRDYVQNHVLDGAYPGGNGQHTTERDLVTELWFDDIGQLRASTSTAYYLENLKPDEPQFVDDSSVEKMVVRPEILLEGGGGRYKLFIVLKAAPESLSDGTLRLCFDPVFLNIPGLRLAVVNAAQTPPDGTAPFADLIYEGWFAVQADAAAALAVSAELLAAAQDAGADRLQSFALVAEEYTTARLIETNEMLRAS